MDWGLLSILIDLLIWLVIFIVGVSGLISHGFRWFYILLLIPVVNIYAVVWGLGYSAGFRKEFGEIK